jgi:isoleucyl-tRNA synthetase
VVDPWSVLNKHGADATRWYMYTATPPGQPRRFSTDLVGESLRKFLMTLWNTYSFFVTYARISNFDPAGAPPSERPELDRWVLSRLNGLVAEVTEDLDTYDPTSAGRAIQAFVEELSNWYVRRSRRRFWKTGDVQDSDSAFHTLYTCLVTLAHVLAPFTPFLAEELYQNLVRSWDQAAPESVHLAAWPVADLSLRDEALEAETRLVMRLASLGRAARAKANVKVRQPLQEVLVKLRSPGERAALERLSEQLLDEINVKRLAIIENEDAYLHYEVKPNLPVLGPKLGRDLPQVARELAAMDPAQVVAAVQQGRTVTVAGHELQVEDLLIQATERDGYAAAQEAGYTLILSTTVTPELAEEGLARELVRRLQEMRRNADFDISDRIVTYYEGPAEIERVMTAWGEYIRQETLSLDLIAGPPADGAYRETQNVDGYPVTLAVARSAS